MLRFLQLFKCRFNGAYTYTLEYRTKGQNSICRRCRGLERQAHYAVRDILYHRLTFIMLNLPQTLPNLCKCKAAPPPLSSNSHVCRQRLLGVEHCVTVMPCIKKTCSWKVQDCHVMKPHKYACSRSQVLR